MLEVVELAGDCCEGNRDDSAVEKGKEDADAYGGEQNVAAPGREVELRSWSVVLLVWLLDR